MSFRWKTILGIGLIELVFLSLLVWQASSYLHESSEAALLARARDTLQLASSVLVTPLIAYDLATLEEQADQILSLDGVEFVRIVGYDRVLVSAGSVPQAAIKPDTTLEDVDDGVFDQVQELSIAEQTFGSLELGLSVRGLKETLDQANLRFYGIASAELVLVALCSWLLANFLIVKLKRLQQAAQSLAKDGSRTHIAVSGDDELADTISAFNTMAETLQAREVSLKAANGQLVDFNRRLLEREQELLVAKQMAEQASSAKSRFLSRMSHEIRSPLNAVLGSISVVRDRIQADDPNAGFLDLAHRSGGSLLQVVNEVLDFSKIEAGHITFHQRRFILVTLLEEVESGVRAHRSNDRVSISHEVDPDVPGAIIADRDHLRQVLIILLDNACKFTEVGEVLVRARLDHAVTETDSDRLTLEVRDTGRGIPPDQVDTVFMEFEQADPARDSGLGGSGLGLSIARQLINGMGGTIGVESEVSVGTSFFVTVPFSRVESDQPDLSGTSGKAQPGDVDAPPDQAEDSNSAKDQAPARAWTVLLVDDVDANRLIASEMLKSVGCEVDTAQDGLEAVEMAASRAYDVILMDMRMPRLNGLEATRRIRESEGPNAAAPIIAVTANAEKAEIGRCKDAGMNDFISKPFDRNRLLQSIQHCIQLNGSIPMSEQSPNPGDDILSSDVLRQLAKDTSESALPMMITVFHGEVQKRMKLIKALRDGSDVTELREQAHALKSCAGTFGALRLRELARRLEDAAADERGRELPELVEALESAAEQTLTEYARYQTDLESTS
jgi:signal transduction histidine kinase/CheY-like chemotaxis protein/HPt (histidine-containing phosphotransfer) domain-containing protein